MRPAADREPSPEGVVQALTQSVGLILRRLRADANPGGFTVSQTSVLAALDNRDGMTTAELARAEAMKPQSMSVILASLEQEGLVERRPHPTDGRRILFSLTARGALARRQRTSAKQAWLLEGVARLDAADQQTLLAAAALIRDIAGARPAARGSRRETADARDSR